MQIPKLREWREARALTQVELAERAGLSVRSVAGYEAGASARLPTVRKLAAGLGVPVEELTGPPSGLEAFLVVHVGALENIEQTVDLLAELVGTAEERKGLGIEERMGYVEKVVGLLSESTRSATEAAREALRIERGEPSEADENEAPVKPNPTEDRLSSLLALMSSEGKHVGTG